MAAPRWRRKPAALLWGTSAAAVLALCAAPAVVGGGPHLHHHGGAAGGPHLAVEMLMVTAMMLPAAAPALRRPERADAREHRPAPAGAVVLAAYLVAWLAFGAVALAGQAVVQAVVSRWGWLEQRPALIPAAALTVAGLYQFTAAKRRFLSTCRHPHVLIDSPHCAWRAGHRLAVVTLGCCWALMLAMVAADGVVTMVGLSVATGAETSTGWGRRLAAPLGVVLLYGAAALGLTGFAAPRAPDPPVPGAW